MYYTTIKLGNDFLFTVFCKNGGLTGDVLESCKNRWSYGGNSSLSNVQSINLNFFNGIIKCFSSEIPSRFLKYTFLIKWYRFKVKDKYLALNFLS